MKGFIRSQPRQNEGTAQTHRRRSGRMVGLVALLVFADEAFANTASVVGGGTLTFTSTTTPAYCSSGVTIDTNFSYSLAGVTNPTAKASIHGGGCRMGATVTPAVLTLTNGCTIEFSGGVGIYSCDVVGYIEPKYQVMGIYYAPPGSRSSVNYQNGYTSGTVNSSSDSYSNSVKVTVSISGTGGFNIGVASIKDTLTGSVFGEWTQTKTNSSSITMSQVQQNGYVINGPVKSSLGIDHGEDEIWIWLNPEVRMASVSSSFLGPDTINIQGLAYDPSDPLLGVDVIALTVNQLQNWTSLPANTLSRLQRAWDPTGGPMNAHDIADVLNTDPFVANPNYDPRFDQSGRYYDNQVAVNFTPTDASGNPAQYTYQVSDNLANSQTHSSQDMHSAGFTIDNKFSGGSFLAKVIIDLSTAYTYTTTNQWSYTMNSSATQSASATVYPPQLSDGYTGPTAVKIYTDTVYGTFMFFAPE